ncbi:hypothetical protein METUNv1_01040 [Methyloversatilis universalis FAM5]|uniref:Uncharacterized protein n=1 Tax=Methyloversatilis universalis (strain ATCC BAA-1314 / DSM 25237 / JCM 13912 / CCUG 52030 / FAM5) TaxID=1000565 RepID=F5R9W4_METUF|nr:hypothetical protein METUNv1_01040 [Methyloversatilis universalis FAM5]
MEHRISHALFSSSSDSEIALLHACRRHVGFHRHSVAIQAYRLTDPVSLDCRSGSERCAPRAD